MTTQSVTKAPDTPNQNPSREPATKRISGPSRSGFRHATTTLRKLRSPIARISFALILLTVSILLFGQFLGLAPDPSQAQLQARKTISETLAIQLSQVIHNDDNRAANAILNVMVERNEQMLSAGVRQGNEELFAIAGDHELYWDNTSHDRSTAEQVIVPLFDGSTRWGTIEVRFSPLTQNGGLFGLGAFPVLVLFVVMSSIVGYPLLLTRVLRAFDPGSVVPERVKSALDTLSEGVLILDDQAEIVFSNKAFANKSGIVESELMQQAISFFDWELCEPDATEGLLPWQAMLQGKPVPESVRMKLQTTLLENYLLVVKCSPIFGAGNTLRGVMVTFTDITALETRNNALKRALARLESSEQEIRRQNEELQILATRDPLTGCFNRRSFFEGFDTLIAQARAEGTGLCCIMADIDHFKSVNDNYGHSIGDKVIVALANTLVAESHTNDLVGRYGGEEFCVVLPECDVDKAISQAERIRVAVEAGSSDEALVKLRITSSFGVAELREDTEDARALMDLADQALYQAKETGRNRVCNWSPALLERAKDKAAGAGAGDTQLAPTATVDTEVPVQALSPSSAPAADPAMISALEQKVTDLQAALRMRPSADNTNMSGRVLLLDRISQAILNASRTGQKVAVLAVSIDTLAQITDTLGHRSGEQLLELTATRVRKMLRETDSVSVEKSATNNTCAVTQLDTNQLALLLTDVDDPKHINRVVERLFRAFDKPLDLNGASVKVRCRVGVSVCPDDSPDAETLLRHSVAAMRTAPRDARIAKCNYYSREINEQAKARIRLETELHQAIERREFEVHYQPKIDLRSGDISGMEALIRWQHPDRGLVMPGEFIHVAEELGLIDEISQQTLIAACRQTQLWGDAGLGAVPIAINLSPSEFHDGCLANRVIEQIKRSGVDPALLELEITESLVMQNVHSAVHEMQQLADTGVGITIDDFGTGYSALSCLRDFPITRFKIDRSFVTNACDNPHDASVISGIVAMGHTMGLEVVAEGIETNEQLLLLHDLDCDIAQGYFISRPLPRERATSFIEQAAVTREKILASYQQQRISSGFREGPLIPEMLGLLNDPTWASDGTPHRAH